jgi:hypothetical protein
MSEVRTTTGIGRALGGALLLASLLAACSSDSDPPPTEAAPSPSPSVSPSATPGVVPPLQPPATPAEAALRLEALVGQHSILAADMMRARIRADSDLAQSANAALGKNTQAMGAVLTPVLGADGVARFEEAWAEHIEELFEYARGLSTDDAALRDHAHEELVEYEADLAQFFVDASKGRLDRKAALDGVAAHVNHLVHGADAYAAGDRATAANLYREAYGHSFGLGDALARALLPPAVGTELDTPSLRLRSALTQLLGENVALVVGAMRSAVTDGADLPSLGAALDGNTQDLTAAVDALFGPTSARQFQSHWADHIDELLAYTRATATDDAAGQAAAQRALAGFEASFAGFWDDTTEHRLGRDELQQAFVLHDRMLLDQLDAYAAKDYAQAHDIGYRTYDTSFTVSGQLATAIGSTVARRLPTGGSQTGGGGTAGAVGSR